MPNSFSFWFGFMKPLSIGLKMEKLASPFSSHGKLGGNSQDADYFHQKELPQQLLQHLNDTFHLVIYNLIQSGGRALVAQLTLDHALCIFSTGAWPFLWSEGERVTSCLQTLESLQLQDDRETCIQYPVTHAKEFLPMSTFLGHLGGCNNQ